MAGPEAAHQPPIILYLVPKLSASTRNHAGGDVARGAATIRRLGWTQEEIGEAVGITHQGVSKSLQ